MNYRTKTYVAFYVDDSKKINNSIASCPDYNYFNLMKAWKANPSFDFSFADPHEHKPVSDDASWDTLKRRLHERLNMSKQMVLLLSDSTKESRALQEEIIYGIDTCNLPIIIVFIGLDQVVELGVNGKYIWTQAVNTKIAKLPSLNKRINEGKVTTMRIAGFNSENILEAMKKYSVNGINDQKQYV